MKRLKFISCSVLLALGVLAVSTAAPTVTPAVNEPTKAGIKNNAYSSGKVIKEKAPTPIGESLPKPLPNMTVMTGAQMERDLRIYRVYDKEAGVLCYKPHYQNFMSCVPLSQTLLKPSDMPQ